MSSSQPDFRFGEFLLNVNERRLLCQGEFVPLTPKVFDTLFLLVKNAGHLVEKEAFFQHLWPDTVVEESSLAQNISVLRKVLGADGNGNNFIETVPKRGYRFVVEVRTLNGLNRDSGTAEATETPRFRNGLAKKVNDSNAVVARSAEAAENSAAIAVKLPARAWRNSVLLLGGVALGVLVLTVYFLRHPAHSLAVTKTIDSVAVLPFANAAPNPDTDFLADGITQSAIDHLSRLGNLKVISMGSVLRYRGRQGDPKQIGRDLGVRSVMTGQVSFHGDRMVVLAELVDASDGTHIWGEQYDRKVSDIMSLQEDIASEIAGKLESRLSKQQEKLLHKRYTQDFEAYEMYLRGRYYWSRRSAPDVERGAAYFQQAIERDPNNALAYAGLSDSYFVRAISGAVPTGDAMPKAKAAALKALELDDSLAEAHTSLALITMSYDWNRSMAEAEYKKALELNPNYSIGHLYYATFLMYGGRHSEALEQLKLAQELDPLSPAIATFIGRAYFYSRNNDEAIRQYRKILESDPSVAMARAFLIDSLEQSDRFEEAVAESKIEAAQLGRSSRLAAAREEAYRARGSAGYWREKLRQVQVGESPGPGSDFYTAAMYAKLGDKDNAFAVLNRVYGLRNMWLMTLKVDPRFDNLHSDPGFQALLDRVGLK